MDPTETQRDLLDVPKEHPVVAQRIIPRKGRARWNSKRPWQDETFKVIVVARLLLGDLHLPTFAAAMGISHWTLRDWRKFYATQARELLGDHESLKNELEAARKERDALLLAVSHFCDSSDALRELRAALIKAR